MPNETIDRIAELLATAGNAIRLQILERLAERGHSPAELADSLFLDRSLIRKHLAKLKDGGLIEADERRIYHIKDADRLARIQRAAPEIFPPPPPLPETE
jgi:DNA-binding transcriptional ArsR family regulator